jgi:hypothetical protein
VQPEGIRAQRAVRVSKVSVGRSMLSP